MVTSKRALYAAIVGFVALGISQVYALGTNAIISRGTGAEVKVSSGTATAINNNKWGPYETAKWTVSDSSWIAIKVVAGTYSQVFISWNSPDTSWSDKIGINADSCNKTVLYPTEYDIMTAPTSTTGEDGTWTKALSVSGNEVGARGHVVDFAGMTWIKMKIIKGKGKIDEVEVFDASKGMPDSWFFLGTKITALMLKGDLKSGYEGSTDFNVPDSNFAAMINMRNKKFTPAVIRGGLNCGITSGDVARDISKYLAVEDNVTFWAIELGTWDAWGVKKDNLGSFKTNLQIIIDSCKAHKVFPIIARVMPTDTVDNTKLWQIPPEFAKVVDTLTIKNQLIAGVDFPGYCYGVTPSGQKRTGYMDIGAKGILPLNYGNFEFQREWAKKMDTVVYKGTVFVKPPQTIAQTAEKLNMLSQNGRTVINAGCAGTIAVFSINGEMIDKIALRKAGTYSLGSNASGLYLVKFTSEKGMVETIPVLNR
jgi:hypothetical protein